jgi:hypothetical protein
MIRKWINLPPGATEKMFYVSKAHGGLNIPNVHTIWKKNLVSKTLILQNSFFQKTRNIMRYKEANFKGHGYNPYKEIIKLREILQKRINEKKCKAPRSVFQERWLLIRILKERCESEIFQNAKNLQSAGSGYRVISEENRVPSISALWNISQTIGTEASKLFSDNLTNNSKIAMYTKNFNMGKCKSCGHDKQTITHILTNCSIAAGIDTKDPKNRQTWRHDNILSYIHSEIKDSISDKETNIFTDLSENRNRYTEFPTELINRPTKLRPDIIIKTKERVIIGELTSPMESNMEKNYNSKKQKYTAELLPKMKNNRTVEIMPFEVSARGTVGESLRNFLSHEAFNLSAKRIKIIMENASIIATMCSLELYKFRNTKEWIPPKVGSMNFPIKRSRVAFVDMSG